MSDILGNERHFLTEADFDGTPGERQTRGLKPRHIDEEEFLFIARQTDDLFAPEMQPLGHAHWLNETIDHAMAALQIVQCQPTVQEGTPQPWGCT